MKSMWGRIRPQVLLAIGGLIILAGWGLSLGFPEFASVCVVAIAGAMTKLVEKE